MTSKSRNIIVVLGVVIVVILALAVVANSFGLLGQRASLPALSGAAGHPATDPIVNMVYMLNCSGKFQGYFTTATGPGAIAELIERKITKDNQEVTLFLPGRFIYEKLVLSRPPTSDRSAWDWYALVLAGRINEARLPCELTMLDRSYNPVATWRLNNAWPIGYSALSKLENSSPDTPPFETLTIIYESIERTK
jgi:phage tail-like protein